MAVTQPGVPEAAVSRGRLLILSGAAAAAVGVALTGSFSPGLGGAFLLAGWLALIVGIHGFGRAGG
jgi:hypothetical protein